MRFLLEVLEQRERLKSEENQWVKLLLNKQKLKYFIWECTGILLFEKVGLLIAFINNISVLKNSKGIPLTIFLNV
ncbi:UNVERIFIED_CONTAM: hypothetical protein Cloal_4369 [Acetivibrio alkalicellulosi]